MQLVTGSRVCAPNHQGKLPHPVKFLKIILANYPEIMHNLCLEKLELYLR